MYIMYIMKTMWRDFKKIRASRHHNSGIKIVKLNFMSFITNGKKNTRGWEKSKNVGKKSLPEVTDGRF